MLSKPSTKRIPIEESEQLDYVTLASNTEGYSASDLEDLVGAALQQAIIRSTKSDEPVNVIPLTAVFTSMLSVADQLDHYGFPRSAKSLYAREPSRRYAAEV